MKHSPEINLAENLKKIMAEKKLTVTYTAKKIKMNKSTLHGYCNGVVPRNLLQLRNLADFLEVSFADLIFGKNKENVLTNERNCFEGHYEITIKRICSSSETSLNKNKEIK